MKFKTSSFRGTLKGTLQQITSFNISGREVFGDPVTVRFTPIKLEKVVKDTSIRTDISGSQGSAEEISPQGRILMDRRVTPKLGDKFVFTGHEVFTCTVESVMAKYDMTGLISHFQVDLKFV
jgi:hypothetical protein